MPHPDCVQKNPFFLAVTDAPAYMSTQLQNKVKITENNTKFPVGESTFFFSLKLKSYRFLIYNTYEMEEFFF